MKEGEQIEHPWLTKAIEGAQKKVEAHNFDIRKNLLEYDDVMNQQRRSASTGCAAWCSASGRASRWSSTTRIPRPRRRSAASRCISGPRRASTCST